MEAREGVRKRNGRETSGQRRKERTWERERIKEQREREEEKQIKTGIRSLHSASSRWRSNMGREAGETGMEAVHRQAREREIYLHILPGRLSDQTVTEWPWERERETVRQTRTDRQGRKIGRQAKKVRESQDVQTFTHESRLVDC